jgi:hypothetical protein
MLMNIRTFTPRATMAACNGRRISGSSSALAEARALADGLDANATTSRSFDAQGLTLTLAIAAVEASCPHCHVAWTEPPDGTSAHSLRS